MQHIGKLVVSLGLTLVLLGPRSDCAPTVSVTQHRVGRATANISQTTTVKITNPARQGKSFADVTLHMIVFLFILGVVAGPILYGRLCRTVTQECSKRRRGTDQTSSRPWTTQGPQIFDTGEEHNRRSPAERTDPPYPRPWTIEGQFFSANTERSSIFLSSNEHGTQQGHQLSVSPPTIMPNYSFLDHENLSPPPSYEESVLPSCLWPANWIGK